MTLRERPLIIILTIAPFLLSITSCLRVNDELARDYVKYFGKNYTNPKGEWQSVRNCTEDSVDDEVMCIRPKERNMLCEICEKAGRKNVKLLPHAELIFAEFLEGNLTFPKSKYRHEMRIDILKCRYEVHATFHNEVEVFHITRGKVENSAYFLDSFYSFSRTVHYGHKYSLRYPYVTW